VSAIGSIIVEGGWAGPVAAGACVAALPWLKRESAAARTLVIGIGVVLMWRYVAWRWTESLPPIGMSLNWFAGLLFVGIETLALIGATISMFFLTRVRDRTPDVAANMGWLTSQPVPPLIDVFICTYNEEEAILERTIVGALAIDYPNYRLWALDDGRRPWLKAMCERMGCGYITRVGNEHAKAGNINNAIAHVARLATPPDYISILDADFVPTTTSRSCRRRSTSPIRTRCNRTFRWPKSGPTSNATSSTWSWPRRTRGTPRSAAAPRRSSASRR
jgi:cellulose synthase (UDP-forming)